nr:hypothetical protein [uncultured Blautia sp.]
MKNKIKMICRMLAVILVLSAILTIPNQVQARDGGRVYKEKFTFMTEPVQKINTHSKYYGAGDVWCESYISHTLEIVVKGKKPNLRLRYYAEMLDKMYTEDIPGKEWKYNRSTKTWTARHKLKKLYGFSYFSLYEKNAKPRRATMRVIPRTDTTVRNFRVVGKPGYINLCWTKINGEIQIFRADSARGRYRKIAEIYGDTGDYSDRKIKAGRRYYYKVCLGCYIQDGARRKRLYLKCTPARGTVCRAKTQTRQLNLNIFQKKSTKLLLSEITWNTKFRNSTELKKILPTMVRKHYSIYDTRYPRYEVNGSKDSWYYLVPQNVVHKWIRDTFGITVNRVNLPQKNGKYMVWQLWWQSIEEPKYVNAKRTRTGAVVTLKNYIGSECTSTYTINVKAANNSRGFVVTSVQ